jgi:DoxX-like family
VTQIIACKENLQGEKEKKRRRKGGEKEEKRRRKGGEKEKKMDAQSESKKVIWTGRVLSGIAIAFLLFDGIIKFFLDKLPPEALEANAALQWPMEKMTTVGTILLICTLLYAVPRTTLLGAVLLTGYLGGAIASHVRVSNPLITHTLFPVYVAVFIWLGFYLRNPEFRRIALNSGARRREEQK